MKRYFSRFTLVEMLTVIAIISILAGIVIPVVIVAQESGSTLAVDVYIGVMRKELMEKATKEPMMANMRITHQSFSIISNILTRLISSFNKITPFFLKCWVQLKKSYTNGYYNKCCTKKQ